MGALADIALTTPEHIHDIICMKFLHITDTQGNYYGQYDTTRYLTVRQMYDLLCEIEAFASELGIELPHPDDLRFWNSYIQ